MAASSISYSDPASVVPVGMFLSNNNLTYRNTFYWNKRAMSQDPNHAIPNAHLYHWLHSADLNTEMGVLESEKAPLENRIWYDYPNQMANPYGAITLGQTDEPLFVGRVLDDGTSQLWQYQYNSLGKVTKITEPGTGRMTVIHYDTNGFDLWQSIGRTLLGPPRTILVRRPI
jgi:hypothetical protein